jgi:hypothetical protein
VAALISRCSQSVHALPCLPSWIRFCLVLQSAEELKEERGKKKRKIPSKHAPRAECCLHRSVSLPCVWLYISYSRLCDEERPVIYNCEFDRYTLGKSLFQNDKPPPYTYCSSFLLFVRALSLSLSLLYISFSTFKRHFLLCRVLRSPLLQLFILLHDGKPDGFWRAAPSSTL